MSRSKLISVSDPSRVGDARRESLMLATELGLNETIAGRVGIVVTEMSNNLLKHAGQGHIILRTILESLGKGIEILAIDKGPGMNDVSKCLEDGYSTAGSPGTGLGAISRLADFFDIYSEPGRGTALLARMWAKRPVTKNSPLQLGAVCVPLLESEPSGDAWSIWHNGDHAKLLLADGLGHGPLAARAADEAVRVFDEQKNRNPAEIIQAMHGPLRATRGASLAVAEISYRANQVRYSGVGNISGVIIEHKPLGLATRSMISHNGTVGLEMRHVTEFSYPWPGNATLVMHSDGLMTRWKLDDHPGLITRDPGIIAAVLFRDYRRSHDDVSVLVMRQSTPDTPY